MCRYVKYTNTSSQLMYVAQEHSIYGSSRVGVDNRKDTLYMGAVYSPAWGGANTSRRALGLKSFELANHLGNILVTVSDKPIYKVSSGTIYFNPEISSSSDYYPFGAPIAGRSAAFGSEYRFGYNTQEKTDEIAGPGNHNTAQFWEYDGRLGRRWNLDPVVKPWETLYHAFSNKPIWNIDPNGANDTKYLDEDGKEIANTNDGIKRTVIVKNDQREEISQDIEKANENGTVGCEDFNKTLTQKIDNHNYNSTIMQRAVIGATALNYEGSTEWNYGVKKDEYPKNYEKCNKFVYDVITEVGIKAPTNPGGSWPLTAGRWGDPNFFIKGWPVLPATEKPQAGDIAAYRFDGWTDATGHAAVFTSPNGITGTSDIQKKISTCSPAYLQNQATSNMESTVIYRRFIGVSK